MNTFMMDLLLYRINTALKKQPLKMKLSKVPVQDAAYQTVYQGIFDKFKAKDYEIVILLQLVLDYFFFVDLDRQYLYEPMQISRYFSNNTALKTTSSFRQIVDNF